MAVRRPRAQGGSVRRARTAHSVSASRRRSPCPACPTCPRILYSCSNAQRERIESEMITPTTGHHGRVGHESPRAPDNRASGQGVVADSSGAVLPLLATTNEIAALLRTTRKAIYAMVERGQLPGVTRIGRRVLIRTPELLDWLRQKSMPSPER